MAQGLFDISPLEPLIAQGFTILTPNLRLSRRIKSQWDASRAAMGLSVWPAIRTLPVEEWLLEAWRDAVREAQVPPLVPLSTAQELLIWQQVIEEHGERGGAFALLRSSAAAELASQALDSLLRWEVDLDATGARQQFQLEQDCATFLQWLGMFQSRLREEGLCTRAQCLASLAAVSTPNPARPVALVYCEDLSPLVRRCLSAVTAGREEVAIGERAAAFAVHPFSDKRDELQGIAAWAAQLHRKDPQKTIGVVIAGGSDAVTALEYLLRREFDCLGDNYNSLPVNFSAGISLAQAPVIRDALGVLSLGLQRIEVSAVQDLFNSRFIDMPDRDCPLAQYFLRELYRGGVAELEVSELRNFASTVKRDEQVGLVLGEQLLAIARMRELRRKASPSRWVEQFNVLLDAWGWPGVDPLDSLEYQQVKRWYRALDEFRAMDGVSPLVDFAGALALLRELCSRQVSHPQTADSPVQVLGPLEAVGLSFDHLWISGMQAGNWPAPARPNPFIPVALQAARRMPHATAEREWDFATTLLRQYQAANGSLHTSYCRQVDGVPDLPSPLIAGVEELPLAEPAVLDPGWANERVLGRRETVDDWQAPAPSDHELEAIRGGAGLLERQSNCPFRAFAQGRLLVEPMPEFGPGLSAAERGNMVHEALRALWEEIGSYQVLMGMDEPTRVAALKRAAEVARRAVPGFRRRALGQACIELEVEHLQTLLAQWLSIESQRSEFAVLALESGVELTLSRLKVRLRVDRIDVLPDGSTVIIDYKTGKARASDWLGERPAKPQLLLYGLASPQPPAALAFGQVRPDESRYVGLGEAQSIPGVATDIVKALGEDGHGVETWPGLNQLWQERLTLLAAEFVEGVARVDPLAANSCTYCGLQPLCRIHIEGPDAGEGEA